jgi:hypothetical protein
LSPDLKGKSSGNLKGNPQFPVAKIAVETRMSSISDGKNM